MNHVKRFLPMAICLVVGYAACHLVKEDKHEHSERTQFLSERIIVHKMAHGGNDPERYILLPYRTTVNGERTSIREQPDEDKAQVWAISFGSGKIWVYSEESR